MTLDQEKQIFYLIQYDIRQILIKVFAKGLPEAKQQLLIKKSRSVGLNHCDDPNAFIEYSNDMEDIFEKYDEYNPNKKKILIVFDDMIADMFGNKNLQPIVT